MRETALKANRWYQQYQLEVQGVLDKTARERLVFIRPFLKSLGARRSIGDINAHAVHQYVIKTAPSFSRRYQRRIPLRAPELFQVFAFQRLYKRSVDGRAPQAAHLVFVRDSSGIEWESVQKLLSAPNKSPQWQKKLCALLLMATYGE